MLPPTTPEFTLVSLAHGAAVGAYALCQAALVVYASHRWSLLRAARGYRPPDPSPPAVAPLVTVQLPLYNEPEVSLRLLDAVAALDHPRERLEVQVLDDSTDGSSAAIAAAVARHRASGLDITHLRRGHRAGFKAGALAAGLARARGEFVAVFDADFLPAPDVLTRLLPHFSAPEVGMVQARWGHLDRDRSALSRAQAVLLDAHFMLDHSARAARGWFLNFNGTAGLWRRSCIEDAGGWSHDTLTEDMDLSYRAQLAGWRFVYEPRVLVPAELPGDMRAFHGQQHRWAKGSIQTARKLLGRVLTAPLPRRLRIEAFLHLTANTTYPLLLVASVLLLPVLASPVGLGADAALAIQLFTVLLGTLPVFVYFVTAQRLVGRGMAEAVGDSLLALLLAMGLLATNTRAVIEGLGRGVGEFIRTPKHGGAAARSPGRGGLPEAVLAAGFASLMAWSLRLDAHASAPFHAALVGGLSWAASGLMTGAHAAAPALVAPPATGGRSSANASP